MLMNSTRFLYGVKFDTMIPLKAILGLRQVQMKIEKLPDKTKGDDATGWHLS